MDTLNEWMRYRGKPNRWAPDWTYRMDPQRREEVRAMLEARPLHPEIDGEGHASDADSYSDLDADPDPDP